MTTIKASSGWIPLNLKELWQARELIFFLTWRDIKVRYKQTIIGAAWAILQPFLTMVIFTVIFGHLAKMPSDGIPYPIFAYSALLPWQFFSHAVTESANTLIVNQQLVTKVYFPRLAMPLSATFSGVVDFFFAFLVLIGMMVYYQTPLLISVIYLPIFMVLAFMTALGVGLWLSALNVRYRDVRYTIPFLIQFWFFATPIAYPSSLVPEGWRFLYGLNPMVGVIEGFRWALFGQSNELQGMIIFSGLIACVICVSGMYYFKRMEKSFADVI
ncbi:MAG: phosphate ABC transporter permease [Candidatus Omnitrophica bacterium CG11_big_fil_rev_8_21_14_0_20_45_26]|uniref:Transport permease protein n=1 Tax=Candidatus Abzuiibacterium crystallinum TaxID=1974748 RepID=A0A2H0LR82_9BACT|nr:MAG: phosphate ABC transporter permease [Candidatus Omnitrophica bacterium CG11_big_fil_rev_8_21_14_0_20_45_26]PIW64717.1 MAG: phosphate ABC transporter permease [Candidatus Omnitrophica bacterium CG12_big_fil_rev_8_21_14_0_65_45_16]